MFLIGLNSDGNLSTFERTFNRCLGLWSNGQTIWLSSLYQIWRLENVLGDGQDDKGYDRTYVPQVGYITGDVDIHDISVDADGRVVFVNTRFGCLATVSEHYSFKPLWQPPFLSKLAAEDRCHLNGLAMQHGQPRYVTICSQSDVVNGWRQHRVDGGCVVSVPSGEIVCTGLSMPHSPRLHDGRLWVLNSGTGFLGYVEPDTGRFEEVTFCPGYVRGLTFHDHFALVGLSKCRQERTFSGLQLDNNLTRCQGEAQCGIYMIDLRSGNIVQWLKLEGVIQELYYVVVLPGVVRPKALGFKTNEISSTVWLEQEGQVTRWTTQDTGS